MPMTKCHSRSKARDITQLSAMTGHFLVKKTKLCEKKSSEQIPQKEAHVTPYVRGLTKGSKLYVL